MLYDGKWHSDLIIGLWLANIRALYHFQFVCWIYISHISGAFGYKHIVKHNSLALLPLRVCPGVKLMNLFQSLRVPSHVWIVIKLISVFQSQILENFFRRWFLHITIYALFYFNLFVERKLTAWFYFYFLWSFGWCHFRLLFARIINCRLHL